MEEYEQGASAAAAAFEFEDDLFVSDLFLRDIINSPGTNAHHKQDDVSMTSQPLLDDILVLVCICL